MLIFFSFSQDEYLFVDIPPNAYTHTKFLQIGRNVKENTEKRKKPPNSLIFHQSFSGMLFIFTSFKTFFTLREAELYLSLQGLAWGLPSWDSKNK